MRRIIAISTALLGFFLLTGQTAVSPDDSLQRGCEKYRSGRYAEAASDLRAAADAMLTPEQMKAYVNSGQFSSLPKFETAIVYLTLAYSKLGKEAEAREQLRRLQSAEEIAPAYATLPLTSDVADFEQVARRIIPSLKLPPNASLASASPPPPAPAPALQAVSDAEQRYIDEKIAEARAEIERKAQERISAIQKQAEQEISAAKAAAERDAQQQIAAARAAMKTQAAAVTPAPKQEDSVGILASLHKAALLANRGDVAQGNEIYMRLAAAPGASREMIAAAAVGLYRTGDFAGARLAFEKLGTLARGEEDIRYYKAVSLFETGHYEEAKKELDCALPYIEMTDDVARYRVKIEQMRALLGSANSSGF